MSPQERQLRARVASYSSWANTSDPAARSAPGRRAFLEKFEDQVDPKRELPEEERARRAEAARKAYFTKLALQSVKARRIAAEMKAAEPGAA